MKILSTYKPELKHPRENPLKKYSLNEPLVFLLRHGQIQGYEKKRFIGLTDVGLDAKGISQACFWKEAFAPVHLDGVYSSLLDRCDHTARLIVNQETIIKSAAFNEINMGTWDGKPFEEIKTHWPEAFKNRGARIDTFKSPEGESFYEVSCRVLPFFHQCINTGKKRILIVTHAGVIRVLLCHILNLKLKDLFQIKVSYGELFVLQNRNR